MGTMLDLPLRNPFRSAYCIQNVPETFLGNKNVLARSLDIFEPVQEAVADEKNLYLTFKEGSSSEEEEDDEDECLLPVEDGSSSEDEDKKEEKKKKGGDDRDRS